MTDVCEGLECRLGRLVGNWKEVLILQPYPDFDIAALWLTPNKKRKMIMHHETSGSVSNYERHLDRALDLMKNMIIQQ
jgi:hypothetical protein